MSNNIFYYGGLYTNFHQFMWVFLLIFARFYGMLRMFILFSKRMPATIRTGLAILFALLCLPYFSKVVVSSQASVILLLMVKELAFGAVLGYIYSLPVWLIEAAGNIIDLQRGEQMGAVLNQLTNNPDSTISKLITQGFIAYFVVANGFLFIIEMTFRSFLVMGVTQFYPTSGPDAYVNLFSSFFYWVVVIGLPIITVMFLLENILGLISSFIPQLNVTVISMPLKSAIALLVLVFYLPTMFHLVMTNFLPQVKLFHL